MTRLQTIRFQHQSLRYAALMLAALLALSPQAAVAAFTDEEFARHAALDGEALESLYATSAGRMKIDVGLVLADFYAAYAPARTFEHLRELSEWRAKLADTNSDDDAYAAAIKCMALVRVARLDEAKQACEVAEASLPLVNNRFVQLRVLSAMTFVLLQSGDLEAALSLALEREDMAMQMGHPFVVARALHTSAAVFTFSDLYTQALDRYERAYRHLQAFEEHPLQKVIAFNLGMSYRAVGDMEGALAAFREGYEWAESTGQDHRAFIAQVSMASVLNELNRPTETLQVLMTRLSQPGEANNPDTRLNAIILAGKANVLLGNLDEAMQMFSAGLVLANKEKNSSRWRSLELARLETLETLGEYQQAIAPAQELVRLLKDEEINAELQSSLQLLSRLYAATGDHSLAYQYSLEAMNTEVEESDSSDHRKLAMLEIANELEREERAKLVAQAAERELRISAERNRLFGWGGVLLFLAAVTIILFDFQRRRQREQATVYRENSAQLEQLVDERTRELEANLVQRMRAEEDRRKLEQELAESEKMRSLGQLTGGVAHDFNNLLTVVKGAAEMLQHIPDMDESEKQELVQAISEAANSGSEINAGLLAYARRQQLDPEPIALLGFFSDARQLFQQTLGKRMVLEIDASDVTILVDRGQLTTAVMNLLSNAREASKGRGSVRVFAYTETHASQNRAIISIRDSGCGMTEQEVARAVEPFYSTKEASIVSGLGLSRVYGFVQQSGGELEIKSTPGEGTTVNLSFPVFDDVVQPKLTSNELPENYYRVLLVDDNDDVRTMVERMLKSLGHVVTIAVDGEQALSLLQSATVDMLITDVLMPGAVSGVELARSVRENYPQLPILMISGLAEAPELDFPLLSKPFSITDMKSAIQSAHA